MRLCELKKNVMRFAIIFVVTLMLIPACSKHKQEKTADELATEGDKYFEKKDYKEAITSYEKLTDWYPFSSHAKEAEIRIADAHYKLKEYDQAIAAYTEFSKLHPSDPQAAYVLYQIGRCYYDQLENSDRDQTAAIKAIDSFHNLITQFPECSYVNEAQSEMNECMKRLAEKDMYVGKFYFKSRHYNAARQRFEHVVSNYPDFGFQQEARDYMERCDKNMAQITGVSREESKEK